MAYPQLSLQRNLSLPSFYRRLTYFGVCGLAAAVLHDDDTMVGAYVTALHTSDDQLAAGDLEPKRNRKGVAQTSS